jgi:hypothetical protein
MAAASTSVAAASQADGGEETNAGEGAKGQANHDRRPKALPALAVVGVLVICGSSGH